jgi:hypothetical protein
MEVFVRAPTHVAQTPCSVKKSNQKTAFLYPSSHATTKVPTKTPHDSTRTCTSTFAEATSGRGFPALSPPRTTPAPATSRRRRRPPVPCPAEDDARTGPVIAAAYRPANRPLHCRPSERGAQLTTPERPVPAVERHAAAPASMTSHLRQ